MPDFDKIKKFYKSGIKNSKEKFFKRLRTLEERGIKKNTLVIFTADHGELFDEYNRHGHMLPICPELVYVPLVFIHPYIEKKEVKNNLPGLIDIIPTIFDLLSISGKYYFEGESILKEKKKYQFSTCRSFDLGDFIPFIERRLPLYNAHSIWGKKKKGMVLQEEKIKPIIGGILDTLYKKEWQIDNWKKEKHFGNINNKMIKLLTEYMNMNLKRRREKWRFNSVLFKNDLSF